VVKSNTSQILPFSDLLVPYRSPKLFAEFVTGPMSLGLVTIKFVVETFDVTAILKNPFYAMPNCILTFF
jgi:hypothetical protein